MYTLLAAFMWHYNYFTLVVKIDSPARKIQGFEDGSVDGSAEYSLQELLEGLLGT